MIHNLKNNEKNDLQAILSGCSVTKSETDQPEITYKALSVWSFWPSLNSTWAKEAATPEGYETACLPLVGDTGPQPTEAQDQSQGGDHLSPRFHFR